VLQSIPSPLIAVRALITAGLLVLLAGGLPKTNNPPALAPTGLTATAGDAQVTLIWTASTGATGYNVIRATQSGGPVHDVGSPTTGTYVDATVSMGPPIFTSMELQASCGSSLVNSRAPQNAPAAHRANRAHASL
jgi:hypothetical protein